MEVIQNTLYVMTDGAYVRRDHLSVLVEVERETKLGVPIHNLQAVVLFGNVMASPSALQLCAEAGVSVAFLTQTGRFLARVDAPCSGNVLLRREQFRLADQPQAALHLGRGFVVGKLRNARASVLRALRDGAKDRPVLEKSAIELAAGIRRLEFASNLNQVRGIEGAGARAYFNAFPGMLRRHREQLGPKGRSRRPPLDPGNALLSFCYALLLADCVAALTAAGLDPSVGFLHTDRPGRPSLALDLMEEFRPLLADRLVLTLVNRGQLTPKDFVQREGGAVEIKDEGRRVAVTAWQERKQAEVAHDLLGQNTRVGMLPHLQARILARCIRGEMGSYIPCSLK